MKISELWLREWVNPAVDAKELANQLTMVGLEVDSINDVAGAFTNVIVAYVTATRRHPSADKLTICDVDIGSKEPLQIVCGASNVRPNLKVALAMIGTVMPSGIVIKEAKLRGELSCGMLCSLSELGLSEQSEGILELPIGAPIGKSLREYMFLDDKIIEVDLTPNRADCLSIRGVAREVAAINKLAIKPFEFALSKHTHNQTLDIKNLNTTACPKYYGRIIKNVDLNKETPLKITERLRRAGVRAINPAVDIINYVMLEVGQPMHVFDLKTIDGGICIRNSLDNEELTLLDKQKVTLTKNTLVIADNTKPLAIAGVMGGLDSAVTFDTTDIFIESAFFAPTSIAGVARSYGLCTDSAQRFERGVDPNLSLDALEYATTLLLDVIGGEVCAISSFVASKEFDELKTVNFYPDKVLKLTGVDVSFDEINDILVNLGMTLDRANMPWKVIAPSYRFDISLDVDLVEEVIRLYGYNKINPTATNSADFKPVVPNLMELLSRNLVNFLCNKGYSEVISYSFVDPFLQDLIYPDNLSLDLLNPISPELSSMRLGLLPGLLASFIYNTHRQQSLVKIFEIGTVFDFTNNILQEQPKIAALMSGEIGSLNWSEVARNLDFYDLKGDLEALFASLRIKEINFAEAKHSALHPGKCAGIYFKDKQIGFIGELNPVIADEFSITTPVILFEISLELLVNNTHPQYKKISKFPQIRRDLSFIIDNNITALQIEKVIIEATDKHLLKSFDIFDIYIGDNIPSDKKSMAISLTLQDINKTLIDEEVELLIKKIVETLKNNFAIILRD